MPFEGEKKGGGSPGSKEPCIRWGVHIGAMHLTKPMDRSVAFL